MLRNSVIHNYGSRKFRLLYCEPYRVVEVLPPMNYVIESLDGSTTKRVYFNRLKNNCGRIKEKSTAENKLKKSSVVVYPTPSERWGNGGRPWSPRSRATPQGLDQRS